MSCGQTRIRSKIKRWWNQFYLWRWRNKYGYFHCMHCCVECKYFDNCMAEFNEKEMAELDELYMDDEGWLWVSDTEAYGGPYTIVEGPIDQYEE